MKKTLLHILSAAALAGGLTACQREAMLPEAGQVPAFSATVSGEPLTKAAPYAGTSLPETVSLGVLAYRYTTSKSPASAWALHASTEAVCDKGRSGASSRKWVPTSRFLWPGTGFVRYFGYAPYGAAGLTVTAADGTSPQLSFTVDADYTKQTDLLVTDQASTQQYRGDPDVTAIDVPFTFNHALTGVRFRVAEGHVLNSVTVGGVYKAGTLTLSDLSSGWTPSGAADGNYTLTSPTLKTDASKAGYVIVDDEYTLLLLPQILTDAAYIEASVTNSLGVSKTITASLEGEVWEPGKLVVYTVSDGRSLLPEEYHIGKLNDDRTKFVYPYQGDTKMISKTDAFVSYAVMQDGSKRPVPFVLEYALANYAKPADGAWSTTPPYWLKASYNPAGSVEGEPIMITLDPQVNSAVDPYHTALSARTAKTDFDLSTRNVATGVTVSRTTANSYVVDAPGTYKLPLVYGNGVLGGSTNASAYAGAADHLDQSITSPYIALQHAGKALSAQLLWTDAPGLIDNVSLEGTGENAYLHFNVPSEYITQGNACVAVLADGVVAWSWHIWVTDATDGNGRLTPVAGFSPLNLGWCDGRVTESYAARPAKQGGETIYCWIRARQTTAGGETSNAGAVRQNEGTVAATSGNSPFWQWGRKDLMQASNGSNDTYGNNAKTYYTAPGYDLRHWENGPVSLGTAIQNPTKFYNYNNAPVNAFDHWEESGSMTLWKDGVKTSYDPCPTGYRIPDKAAFEALGSSFVWGSNSKGFPGSTVSGLFFPASGFRKDLRFFSVGTYGSCWTTTLMEGRGDHAVYSLSFASTYFRIPGNEQPPVDMQSGLSVRPVAE